MGNHGDKPKKKKDKKLITRQKNGPYSSRSARIKLSEKKEQKENSIINI